MKITACDNIQSNGNFHNGKMMSLMHFLRWLLPDNGVTGNKH